MTPGASTHPVVLPVPSEVTIAYPYSAIIRPVEGGGYWAEIKQIPGCVAQGASVAELWVNLHIAITEWVATAQGRTADDERELNQLQAKSLSAQALAARAQQLGSWP